GDGGDSDELQDAQDGEDGGGDPSEDDEAEDGDHDDGGQARQAAAAGAATGGPASGDDRRGFQDPADLAGRRGQAVGAEGGGHVTPWWRENPNMAPARTFDMRYGIFRPLLS